jgi:hypothetical protein
MRTVEGVARMLDAADGSMSARATFYEALSSNDLVAFATGVLIDRQIERGYTEIEKQWPKFFTHTTVRNFKPKSIAELHLGAQSFYDIPDADPLPLPQGRRAERVLHPGRQDRCPLRLVLRVASQ